MAKRNRTKRNRYTINRTKRGGVIMTKKKKIAKLKLQIDELWRKFEPFVSIFHDLLAIKKNTDLDKLNTVIQEMAEKLDLALSPNIPLQQQLSDLLRDTGDEGAAIRMEPNPTLYTDLYKNSE